MQIHNELHQKSGLSMTTETTAKNQIYQIIDSIPMERLPDLLRMIRQFMQAVKSEPTVKVAPIYQIHQHAVDTGISDLAAQHDHYLYGTARHNG